VCPAITNLAAPEGIIYFRILERSDTMSICADKDWNNMELVKVPSNPSQKETFDFKDVRTVDGIIRGKVYKDNNYVSDLSGTCSPFDSRENVVRLSFFFTAPRTNGGYVDIVLSGLGIQPLDSQAVFRGGFVALDRQATQAKSEVVVNFDPGDTGTGTGMQAQ